MVGVWNDGELASVPGGRCLAADASVTPFGRLESEQPVPTAIAVVVMGHELKSTAVKVVGDPVPLGPVAVNVDYERVLSRSTSTAPCLRTGTSRGHGPLTSRKLTFGPLTVGVLSGSNFTPIATIQYAQYQQYAYEASAGYYRYPVSRLRHGRTSAKRQPLRYRRRVRLALLEQIYTAETDTRGIYLDQNGQQNFRSWFARWERRAQAPTC